MDYRFVSIWLMMINDETVEVLTSIDMNTRYFARYGGLENYNGECYVTD